MSICEYQICTYCVMDTTDPEIIFDDNGVCNHCKDAEQKLKNGWFPNEHGKELLETKSHEIREYGRNKEYDCIIGVSGGVDSSYLLHLAKVEMKLNPLVVHVDAGWNSEIAVRNIESLVKKLDLDLVTFVVDWDEMRDVQVAFLKSSLANQDVPQDHVFFAKLYEFAIRKRIKYVITGSNLSSESILPASWGYEAMDSIQLNYIHKKYGELKLKNYPTISYWKYKIYYPYIKKMEIITPLNWIDYDKNKAIDFLIDNYGWRYYGGKHHESKWTKFFQAYFLPQKFGFDKRRAHLSSLIVAGQMARVDALTELQAPLYDLTELQQDKTYIAKKLGITLQAFESLIRLKNRDFSEYPNYQRRNDFFVKLKKKLKAWVGD